MNYRLLLVNCNSSTNMKFSLILCLIGLSGCQGQVHSRADEDLHSLLDDYYDWSLKEHPEYATYFGVNTWNAERESFNISVYPERKAAMVGFYSRLSAIKQFRLGLSEENKVNFDILEDMMSTYIAGYTWLRYGALNPMNFLEGEPTDPGFMARTFPLKTEQDFEDYLARLTKSKLQLEEYILLFREAIRLGRTMNVVSINRVPGQIATVLDANARESEFYTPFNKTLTDMMGISDSKKQDLRSRAATIIQNNVLTPYRKLKSFLEDEYIPNARPSWGVSGWDNGQAYYEACLKWHLSQDVTAQEIHQKGLQEVERISTRMKMVMNKQGFIGTIAEYFKHLKTVPGFSFSSGEAILQAHRDIMYQRIKPKLAKFFTNLSDMPIKVKALPTDGPLAAYSRGADDGSRPATFWVNILRPNETYKFDMVALSAHEANPGHHLQISYSQKRTVHPFRKHIPYAFFNVPFTFPSYTSYVEGWGLYAEALAEEMGLYKDDYELMGRYSLEIFRACRLVVDSGIHSLGWSRDRAIAYLLNYTANSRPDVEIEIDRYITWPGQACAYKFGELKIWELRRRAELCLGDRFDIKEFHATVLDVGAVPLHMLDKAVENMLTRARDDMVSDTTIVQSSAGTLFFSAILLFVLIHRPM